MIVEFIFSIKNTINALNNIFSQNILKSAK